MRDHVIAGDSPEVPYTDSPPRAPPEALLTQTGVKKLTLVEDLTPPRSADAGEDGIPDATTEAILEDHSSNLSHTLPRTITTGCLRQVFSLCA